MLFLAIQSRVPCKIPVFNVVFPPFWAHTSNAPRSAHFPSCLRAANHWYVCMGVHTRIHRGPICFGGGGAFFEAFHFFVCLVDYYLILNYIWCPIGAGLKATPSFGYFTSSNSSATFITLVRVSFGKSCLIGSEFVSIHTYIYRHMALLVICGFLKVCSLYFWVHFWIFFLGFTERLAPWKGRGVSLPAQTIFFLFNQWKLKTRRLELGVPDRRRQPGICCILCQPSFVEL